jgi:hypothetical protein
VVEDATETNQVAKEFLDFTNSAAQEKNNSVPKLSQSNHLSSVDAQRELKDKGLRFYDQDEFVDSVRRNDLRTLQLFLAAAAIHPGKADTKGETALSLAKSNLEIKNLLAPFIEAEKAGKYPAPAEIVR